MKTPREILLQRHGSVEPRLDSLRKQVVAEHVIAPQLDGQRQNSRFDLSIFAMKIWVELILPCRRFWIGAAAVWLVILTANLALDLAAAGTPQTVASKTSPPNGEIMAALKAQRGLMTQLLGPTAAPVSNGTLPSPRTEQRQELFIA